MNAKLRVFAALAAVSVLLLAASCAKEPRIRKPTGAMDTPEHHVLTGLRLLEEERPDDAEREFNLAVELDPKYSRAFSGLGITTALKGDFDSAFRHMEAAEDTMKSEQDKLDYHVGMVRVYSA